MHIRHIIGCMSGTSCDGIDAALVRIEDTGLAMRCRFIAGASIPMGDLGPTLLAVQAQHPITSLEFARLARELSLRHAEVVRELVSGHDRSYKADFIAVHGQTLAHAPPLSLQLFNPATLAHEFKTPVVFDLRAADLDAGGQGAPITPLADWVLFRDQQPCTILNLGGFSNATRLGARPEDTDGFDICACNQLLDVIAARSLNQPFDRDGAAAMSGHVNVPLLAKLESLLERQASGRRSLGTGDEPASWIDEAAAMISGPDLARTGCRAIAQTIARRLGAGQKIIIAGGGVHNRALIAEVSHANGRPVVRTDETGDVGEAGIPIDMREAVCMAVLGGLSYDGVPITIPRITRLPGQATAPVAGSWVFPGGLPSGITIPPVPAQAVATPAPEAATNDSAPIAASPPDRSHIVTELRNPRSMSLHELSLRDVLAVINDEDQAVAAAVHKALPMIEGFVVELAPRFESGGRLIYIGAGSSGRLGVLDASECPPTFQLDPGRVIGIIAGGDGALRKSSEGKEDDPCGSHHDLAALNLAPGDTLLGIAAGGTTPYVHGALRLARDRGCLTSLLTCTTLREPPACDHFLTIETGPEVLTGSTRMKAGTATKLVLNMISTALMVRTGRVYENLMVDLRASNDKLRDRAARIISHLTGLERQPALELLDAAGGLVKVAIVMHRRSLSATAAVQLLDSRRGRLDAVLSH